MDAVEAFDFFFEFLARRDVANKAGKHRLRCRSNRRNGQLDRKLGAVGANRFELEPLAEDGAFARSEVVGEASTMCVPQTRRNNQFHHGLAERLLAPQSERGFRSRVEFDDFSFMVDGDEAVQRRLEYCALETLALAQLRVGTPLLAPRQGVGERALHGRGQTHEIRLQDVVGGAALDRVDGGFLADRSRNEDERRVRAYLARQRERCHPVEAWQREVGQDHVWGELSQRIDEGLLAIHDPVSRAQTGPRQLHQHELGVGRHVFRHQDSQLLCHLPLGWLPLCHCAASTRRTPARLAPALSSSSPLFGRLNDEGIQCCRANSTIGVGFFLTRV